MVTARRDPNLLANETCDYHTDPQDAATRCGTSPAGFIGEYYYACENHVDDMADWLEA